MIIKKFFRELLKILFTLIQYFPGATGVILRKVLIVNFFKKKGSKISLDKGVEITGFKNIIIGNNVNFVRYSSINANDGKIEIGNNVNINYNTNINASNNGEIKIGNNVTIGQNCVIRASDHKYELKNVPIIDQGHSPGKIIIGEDIWIGANCVITKNVSIGSHSIINAGSIVTRDVEKNSIVGGNPAKIVSKKT